jgi:hypothetical protein
VNRDLTLYLGVRYELVGVWHEQNKQLANFIVDNTGGYWVVPNAQIAALLPPAVQALGRIKTADQIGVGDGLINADKNNFSPRLGFAYRLGGSDRSVLRGGFGIFHPTVAVQGLRDLMATNEFRYGVTGAGAPSRRASRPARSSSTPGTTAARVSTPTSRARTSTSTTSPTSTRCPATSACASATSAPRCATCSSTGSRTSCPRAPTSFDPENRGPRRACPSTRS